MTTKTAVRARAKEKAVTDVVEALSPTSIGGIADHLFDLREQKRELEAKVAKIEAEYKEHEERLFERLEKEGTDAARGKRASVSVSMGTVATVDDWAEVEKYVKRTGNFQLFQRRISDASYRELLELKGAVPGITPFTKKRLNVRAV